MCRAPNVGIYTPLLNRTRLVAQLRIIIDLSTVGICLDGLSRRSEEIEGIHYVLAKKDKVNHEFLPLKTFPTRTMDRTQEKAAMG